MLSFSVAFQILKPGLYEVRPVCPLPDVSPAVNQLKQEIKSRSDLH